MATCMSSRASPATQPASGGPMSNRLGPSPSFVLSIDMFDAAKSWQQQPHPHPHAHAPPKRATFTAVKKSANATPTAGNSAPKSAACAASASAATSVGGGPAGGVSSAPFHLGILSSGGERICPIPSVDWREAARKAEETRMLASEVCPIPAQNWRKDAPPRAAETRNSTLSSTPAAAEREAPGTGSPSAAEREGRSESPSSGSTTRPTAKKHQTPVQRGNHLTAASRHNASKTAAAAGGLSVTIEDASSEDSFARSTIEEYSDTEFKSVSLPCSVAPMRVGILSAQSQQLRENAAFGSAVSPAASPTPSACSARSSVISSFSIARRSSFSSSASSSAGGSSISSGGGGYGDFTPPISRCSTLLGSASSTIDENDVPSFAPKAERDATPSYLLSSRPKSPQRRSSADYHRGDEDGGAAISRVCTAPSVAEGGRSRPPRLVTERLRLGLPSRTSSLPLVGGLDSPTASSANSPATNDMTGTTVTTGMARTRMSGHSVPKCSSLANDGAPAGLQSPVSRTTWEHMRGRTVAAAAGVKEQGGEDLETDGEETRGQHWHDEDGMGEAERESQVVTESACLNWEDVEELCHRMDIAGIRIETLDIQPVNDDTHPPSQAQQGSSNLHHATDKAHTGTTAAAASCYSFAGRSGPMSVGTDMTGLNGGDSCAGAASVVALKFSGMHMWYYPGDNVKPLFRDAVQW